MFSRLIEFILTLIIPYMAKKIIKLTEKEKSVEEIYKKKIPKIARHTKKQVIVAMIGLVASGKSTVAKEIASKIGAGVIEADAIRVELRKIGEKYDNAFLITKNIAQQIIKNGGNLVLDSDFIDPKKRALARNFADQSNVRLVFVRTICDIDISIGRAISANSNVSADDFFGGATTPWQGEKKGSVVKIREMIRRMSLHYKWENALGGKWKLKTISVPLLGVIDTSDNKKWHDQVSKLVSKLK